MRHVPPLSTFVHISLSARAFCSEMSEVCQSIQLPSACGIACVSELERSTDSPELEILDLEFLLE